MNRIVPLILEPDSPKRHGIFQSRTQHPPAKEPQASARGAAARRTCCLLSASWSERFALILYVANCKNANVLRVRVWPAPVDYLPTNDLLISKLTSLAFLSTSEALLKKLPQNPLLFITENQNRAPYRPLSCSHWPHFSAPRTLKTLLHKGGCFSTSSGLLVAGSPSSESICCFSKGRPSWNRSKTS